MKNPFMLIALLVAALLTVSAASALNQFTQTEIDTAWQVDRTFPTGGVESVSVYDRSPVLRIGVDSSEASTGRVFYLTEGIKTSASVQDNFGTDVSIDLYIDPAWEGTAVRAGFWVAGDDGEGARNDYAIIEFVNSEPCAEGATCSSTSSLVDHEGFRTWNSDEPGTWVVSDVEFEYGEWVTLDIVLDTDRAEYDYYVDGEYIGSAPGGEHFIREIFLNSFNYGHETLPTLNTESYDAHWHAGVEAAPAIASDLLKAADIKPRYSQGRDGGNHIADVADVMGEGTDFKGVSMGDAVEYECEVVKFLRDNGAMVRSSNECLELVEIVEVVSSAATPTLSESILAEGTEYVLKARGTASAGDRIDFDAKYSITNRIAGDTWTDTVSGYVSYGPTLLELFVDGYPVDWGAFNEDHVYQVTYVGTGNEVSLSIYDVFYPNNEGSLFVDIYAKLW